MRIKFWSCKSIPPEGSLGNVELWEQGLYQSLYNTKAKIAVNEHDKQKIEKGV